MDDNNITIDFTDLDFDLGLGLNDIPLAINIALPTLNVISNDSDVNIEDLTLSIELPDTNLSSLDLSVVMPYFHYTDLSDIVIDISDMVLYTEPSENSTELKSRLVIGNFDFAGILGHCSHC